MKKKMNLIKIFSFAAILSAGYSMTALAEDGWVEEENGWAYYEGEGERAVSC